MTSFVVWIGIDSRGPASLHFASDSRISWKSATGWNRGRKVFSCTRSADLFGYVGDVLFPSLVLGQVADAINAGMWKDKPSGEGRSSAIVDQLMGSFADYPQIARNPFDIVHGSRLGEGMGCEFLLEVFSWNARDQWKVHRLQMPVISSALWIGGSGKAAIEVWQERWDSSSQGSTSRAVFSAFCDALHAKSDPRSGGAPQLASLYRIGPGRSLGCVFAGVPNIHGMPLEKGAEQLGVEWRNELFERCDSTGAAIEGAQRHHAPRGLGKARGA